MNSIAYNTKEDFIPKRVSDLPFEYLIYLNTEAYFGSSREREEKFLLNTNYTLLEIENAYASASELYDLDLLNQCTSPEENSLSSVFRCKLEKAIPSLYWRKKEGQEGADKYPPVDFDYLTCQDWTYIYMLISRLANPAIQFQFIKCEQASIGGAGLFFFN